MCVCVCIHCRYTFYFFTKVVDALRERRIGEKTLKPSSRRVAKLPLLPFIGYRRSF